MRPLEDIRWVHIVGVGGSATSGLARLLRARGVTVSGSDRCGGGSLDALLRDGMQVSNQHQPDNIGDRVDLVVHSAAVPNENLELVEARRRGIPIVKFAQFLGEMAATRDTVAVAGTHGKTTTAGMLASIFVTAGRDPSFLMGGEHRDHGSNWRHGAGSDFIVEACEYDRSFHSLRPKGGIITTLELDHPELYDTESKLTEAFDRFISGFLPESILVVNGDALLCHTLLEPGAGSRVTFGFGAHNQWRARNFEPGARPSFEVLRGVRRWGRVTLSVPGQHNVYNALATIAFADRWGISRDAIVEGLARFVGMNRRFQVHTTAADIPLIDDYAHHPTEVQCALQAVRDVYPDRRLCAVFQPHQWGRLQAYGEGFVEALRLADTVVQMPVFSVRENPSDFAPQLLEEFSAKVAGYGVNVTCCEDFEQAAEHLQKHLVPELDVCIFLGAGDIVDLTQLVIERLGRVGGGRA